MTQQTTTTATAAATLSEQELFAEFLQTDIVHPFAQTYKPDDSLRDPGDYGDMEEFSDRLTDELMESDAPEDNMERIVDQLENYKAIIENVMNDFRAMKASRVVEDDGEGYRYRSASTVLSHELSSREQALEVISNALDAVTVAGDVLHDHNHTATQVLEELERRVVGIAPEGYLVFGSEKEAA